MNHLSQAIFVLGFIVIIVANLAIHDLIFCDFYVRLCLSCIYNQLKGWLALARLSEVYCEDIVDEYTLAQMKENSW